jgi:hypothetical protein
MKIVDHLADKLYLDISTVPDAGIGLFTGKDIIAGVPVCEYKGDSFKNNKEGVDLLERRYDYTLSDKVTTRTIVYGFMHWPSLCVVDANPYLCKNEVGVGSFVNDVQTHEQRKDRPKEVTGKYWVDSGYNVFYWPLPNESKFILISLRPIKMGEELFADYGDTYWETMEQRQKELKGDKKKEDKIEKKVKEALENAEGKNEQT